MVMPGIFSPQAPAMGNPMGGELWNLGGGADEWMRRLEEIRLAQSMNLARRQMGMGLLGSLFDIQRDPFSIVPALQAYKAGGGGTLAPAAAFAQTGGAGTPSPYGGLVDRLLADLAKFSLASEEKPANQPVESMLSGITAKK